MAVGFYDRRRFIFFFDELNRINTEGLPVEPWVFNSAKIADLVKEARNYGRTRPYDLMFIEGGICDITTKNHSTNKITFDWDDHKKLSSHVIHEMDKVEMEFKKDLPASNLIVCNIIGADLEKDLKRHTDYEQYVMDEAIFEINDYVFKRNIEKGFWAPDMASPVHRETNGTRKCFYNHMATDGLHLGEGLKLKWAKKLLKTAYKYQ